MDGRRIGRYGHGAVVVLEGFAVCGSLPHHFQGNGGWSRYGVRIVLVAIVVQFLKLDVLLQKFILRVLRLDGLPGVGGE